MPRTARLVVPGTPHHVTQRGNRRQQTFFCDADYGRYVELLSDACREAGVETLAWCLMPNHVHLILVPGAATTLSNALSDAHQRYTWLINRRNNWQGHLWQSRFYSCPLDREHLRSAIRYVELNPVRAGMVASAEQWRWSSVAGHLSGCGDNLVGSKRPEPVRDVVDWLAFLAAGLTDEEAKRIRALHTSGRPRGRPRRDRENDENGDSHLFRPAESLL